MDRQTHLPFDKSEYARRCRAIEDLTPQATGLKETQLKCVRRLLKHVFKHRQSSCHGIMTFVQSGSDRPGCVNLARDMEVSRATLGRWLAWCESKGLLERSISCDYAGVPRTTVSICWDHIFSPVASNPALTLTNCHSDWSHQTLTVEDQTLTVEDQTLTVDRPNAHRERFIRTNKNQLPTATMPEPAAAAEVSLRGKVIAAELARAGVERAGPIAAKLVTSGVSVELVRETVSEFLHPLNRNKFTHAGAVVDRLRSGCWPVAGVLSQSQLTERTARAKEHHARARIRDMHERDHKAHVAAETARIERQFGHQWDSMSRDHQRAFIAEHLSDLDVAIYSRQPRSLMVRMAALDALAACEGVGEGVPLATPRPGGEA